MHRSFNEHPSNLQNIRLYLIFVPAFSTLTGRVDLGTYSFPLATEDQFATANKLPQYQTVP